MGKTKKPEQQDKLRIPSETKGQPPPEGSKDEGKDFLPGQQERDWSTPGGKYSRGRDRKIRRRGQSGGNRGAALVLGLVALTLNLLESVPRSGASPIDILGEEKPTFDAWDCREPKQIQVLGIPEQSTENKVEKEVNSSENKDEQITIFQRAKKHFLVIRCTAFRRSVSLHCGMFSHSLVIRPSEVRRPVRLSIKECEQMHSSAIWSCPNNNQKHPISSSGKTYLNYIEAGRMRYHHHQVSCEGSKQVINGKVYEGILTMVDVEVEIKEVEARRTEQGFEVKDNRETFRGGPRDGQVTQGQGT